MRAAASAVRCSHDSYLDLSRRRVGFPGRRTRTEIRHAVPWSGLAGSAKTLRLRDRPLGSWEGPLEPGISPGWSFLTVSGFLSKGSFMSAPRETAPVHHLVINGESVETERYEEVRSPYDGSLIARVGLAGPAELERAIDSGMKAFDATRAMPRHARRRILRAIVGAIRAEHEDLARTLA